MGKSSDTYKETKVFNLSNCIARVQSPVLTDEERTRRMKKIHNSAAELLKSKK